MMVCLQKEIEAIPEMVSEVFNCGRWEYHGQKGFYRIVYIEFYRGCSLLYVQWMKERNFTDGSTKVLHTLSIDEFNADDHIEITFDRPECEQTDKGIKLKMITDSGNDDKKRTVEVDVFYEFGKYSYKEQVIK